MECISVWDTFGRRVVSGCGAVGRRAARVLVVYGLWFMVWMLVRSGFEFGSGSTMDWDGCTRPKSIAGVFACVLKVET